MEGLTYLQPARPRQRYLGTVRSLVAAAPIVLLAAVPAHAQSAPQAAVLAGGCFWGVEYLFEHVNGVIDVKSGYAGGSAGTADYQTVSSGATRHAESVKVIFDPAVVSYATLLRVFFAVAHDPTQLNRQGPDIGSQYRSAIFYTNDEQRRAALAYIEQLGQSKQFARPIVTVVAPLEAFYQAEDYHQDYVVYNPRQPYVVFHDLPKVIHLRAEFPELYRERTKR